MEYFENIELLDHLLYLLMPEFSAVDIETIIPLGDDDYEEVRERCIFFNRYYNDGIFFTVPGTETRRFNEIEVNESVDIEVSEDEDDLETRISVGTRLAKNVFSKLKIRFPDEAFCVYADMRKKGTISIRFHKKRDNEPDWWSEKTHRKNKNNAIIKITQ